MKITKVLNVNIDNVPVSNTGKSVYKALMIVGAKTTEELSQHLDISEAVIDLMLAHLLRHDLIELEV